METKQPAYFTDYRSLKMTRDAQGVLVVEFHTNGGPLTFTAQDHTDFVDAFYRISQDRTNKIVILTGTRWPIAPAIGVVLATYTFGSWDWIDVTPPGALMRVIPFLVVALITTVGSQLGTWIGGRLHTQRHLPQ